ncbi:MAG: GTP-binding protein [Christensenellales bacterium]
MREVGVYIFCGFLEAGKTSFISNALASDELDTGEKTALFVFEDGEEEYEEAKLKNTDVFHLDKNSLTLAKMTKTERDGDYTRIFVEYNGMWELGDFLDVMPENWVVCQIMAIFDCTNILIYNANMRQQVFDKIQYADLIVFNRYKSGEDKTPYHKLVRGVSRNNDIIYENERREIERDDIEDPLPFDVNAPVIEIEDRDYAYFYRELTENMRAYHGKTVRFLCVTAYDRSLGKSTVVVGRHIMTCCEADTKYCGLVCEHNGSRSFTTGEWYYLTAKICVAKHKVYGGECPVLLGLKFEKASEPEPEDVVTTFY